MNNVFLQIFNLYKNDVYRLAYSYTKNIYDAEDITQNVFMKLYKHQSILDNSLTDMKKWLLKVTSNECKTYLLSSWKRKVTSLLPFEEKISIEKGDEEDEVLNAIMSLEKKYRVVLYLYYYEDYKIKEISSILHLTQTNVQTRLARARDMLKNILKKEKI